VEVFRKSSQDSAAELLEQARAIVDKYMQAGGQYELHVTTKMRCVCAGVASHRHFSPGRSHQLTLSPCCRSDIQAALNDKKVTKQVFDQGALRCLSLLPAAISIEACSLTRRVRSRAAQKHVFALIRVDIAPKFVEHLKANQSSLAEESFTLKSGLSEEDKVGWRPEPPVDRSLTSVVAPCFLPGSVEGCVLRELHGPLFVHGAAQLLPLLRKRLLRALRLQTGRSAPR
jgi:hypothetical protein